MANKCNCKNCIFCHEFKSLKDGEWYISSCCTYFVQTGNNPEYDVFVIEVCTNDVCECFSEKRSI